MALYGKLDEFNGEEEEWSQYIEEQLEHFFTANDIKDEGKKHAILLSVCGSKTYKLLRNLVAPENPGEFTFDQLKSLVQEHYNPRPSMIVQRSNSYFQHQGESVATSVAELYHLVQYCDCGGTLEDMLRDRLVCGLTDDQIQHRLLAEPQLHFKRAIDLALVMEAA
uniref:Uncharacterized protein n=1 Tax=Latimeria chalumnae TaxID=7897 RepID=H3B0J1_LATCH